MAEWNRQTVVMNAIADPSTPEAMIARNAFDKLDQLGKELSLPKSVVDLAHQCAQKLLVMRPSEEAPSDFQEYTLVAVAAVAAYLGRHHLGERHGLQTLATKYGQDAGALEQVFEYIIASVSNYRETYMRMQALQAAGALDDESEREREREVDRKRGTSSAAHQQHPTAGLMTAMADLDGFAAKLDAILQADLTAAAMAAGPLEVPPLAAVLGPLHGGEPWAQEDHEQQSSETEAVMKNLKALQEQVALLDRMQSIRVKNIQDEYQRFMERVRTKAQSAIDQANTGYGQQRSILMSRFDALVTFAAQQRAAAASLPSKERTTPSMTLPPSGPVSSALNPGILSPGTTSANPTATSNPMSMLSHTMASQLLALQANMAAAVFGVKSHPATVAQHQAAMAAAAAAAVVGCWACGK